MPKKIGKVNANKQLHEPLGWCKHLLRRRKTGKRSVSPISTSLSEAEDITITSRSNLSCLEDAIMVKQSLMPRCACVVESKTQSKNQSIVQSIVQSRVQSHRDRLATTTTSVKTAFWHLNRLARVSQHIPEDFQHINWLAPTSHGFHSGQNCFLDLAKNRLAQP